MNCAREARGSYDVSLAAAAQEHARAPKLVIVPRRRSAGAAAADRTTH